MTFHCWVFRRWVFEAWYRECPTRNLELGIPDVRHSRRWVFQMLGSPYENQSYVMVAMAYVEMCDYHKFDQACTIVDMLIVNCVA